MKNILENLQQEKEAEKLKAKELERELKMMEINSSRFIKCVEENRKQKLEVLELLQEKV